METHICVYQTVVDLISQKYKVQVVGDAVSSRTAENKQMGLERIRSAGGVVTSTEMILCELMKTARHPKFKEIAGFIK
jgi:isochorismate hydrolase